MSLKVFCSVVIYYLRTLHSHIYFTFYIYCITCTQGQLLYIECLFFILIVLIIFSFNCSYFPLCTVLPVNFAQGGSIRNFLSYPSNLTDFPSAWGRMLDNDWNSIYIYASNPQNNYHIDIFFLKHGLYYEIFGLNSGFSSSCRLTLIVIRLKTFTGSSSWEGDLISTIKKQDQMRSETQRYSLLCLCSLAGLMLV